MTVIDESWENDFIPVTVNVLKKAAQLTDAEAGPLMRQADKLRVNGVGEDFIVKRRPDTYFLTQIDFHTDSVEELKLIENALATRKPRQDFEAKEIAAEKKLNNVRGAKLTAVAMIPLTAAICYQKSVSMQHKDYKASQETAYNGLQKIARSREADFFQIGGYVFLALCAAFAIRPFSKRIKTLKENLSELTTANDKTRDELLEAVRTNLKDREHTDAEWRGYDSKNIIN